VQESEVNFGWTLSRLLLICVTNGENFNFFILNDFRDSGGSVIL
jgi:hypothetical protein